MLRPRRAAVVGAGIVGLLMADTLIQQGWELTVFHGPQACSRVAAAMLAPHCERDGAHPLIEELGCCSLELWPRLVERVAPRVFFQRRGTVVLAHAEDQVEVERLQRRMKPGASQWVQQEELALLEPVLGRFNRALYVENEGQIDGPAFMAAMVTALHRAGVCFQLDVVDPQELCNHYSWVIDCRGIHAGDGDLRAVRGEILELHAPEIHISRPVRLMHPRYPLYVVPRPGDRFLLGASSIESCSTRPVTVRSCMELLSAAYALHPAFAEASIVNQSVGLRPAYPDNLPRIERKGRLLRINGLYRHGFLLGPAVVERAYQFISKEEDHGDSIEWESCELRTALQPA